jgi:hypothetical protein
VSSFLKAMHDLVGIGQWQRKSGGGTAFLVVWCGVVASMIGFGLWAVSRTTQDLFKMVPELQARPVRSASDEELGKGVFQGTLRGPARNAPSGAKAVAWYAWLDQVKRSGKSTTRVRVCTLEELDGLTLEADGKRTPFKLESSTFELVEPGSFSSPTPGKVELHGAVTRTAVPASVRERPRCKSSDASDHEYNEVVWTDGRELVVSGLRDAKGIGPSGDGADFVASVCSGSNDGCADAQHGKDFVLRSWVNGVSWVTMIAFAIAGVFITVLGGLNLWYHRAQQKQRRTIARRLA